MDHVWTCADSNPVYLQESEAQTAAAVAAGTERAMLGAAAQLQDIQAQLDSCTAQLHAAVSHPLPHPASAVLAVHAVFLQGL